MSPKERPYPNSDAAAGIEVGTGIEEISHSAAFELGRLLGMSDLILSVQFQGGDG